MRAQAQMSQWRATCALSARHVMRSMCRIGLVLGGVCLPAGTAAAQTPPFTVPRLITPTVSGLRAQAQAAPAAEPIPAWRPVM